MPVNFLKCLKQGFLYFPGKVTSEGSLMLYDPSSGRHLLSSMNWFIPQILVNPEFSHDLLFCGSHYSVLTGTNNSSSETKHCARLSTILPLSLKLSFSYLSLPGPFNCNFNSFLGKKFALHKFWHSTSYNGGLICLWWLEPRTVKK